MLQSVAVPGSTAVPSSQVLDEEGQQHYEVQQHAAAVQLLNRSLAVAHLRAEMIKPKGGAVAVQPKESSAGAVVKLEPGMQPAEHMQQPPQQQSVWQLPQQPQEQRGARRGIVFNIISSNNPDGQVPAADSMRQVPPQRRLATLTSQARKRPDAAAASAWLQSEQSGDLVGPAGFRSNDQTPPAPRIVADAAQRAQGMAHWVHAGAEGAAGQVGEQPGDVHAAAAPGMVEPAPLQPEEDMIDEDRDEEEWI